MVLANRHLPPIHGSGTGFGLVGRLANSVSSCWISGNNRLIIHPQHFRLVLVLLECISHASNDIVRNFY